MKIKSSGSLLLYIIIIALVVYLLFLRQQGTSGYRNNEAARLSYAQGYSDYTNGVQNTSSFMKVITKKGSSSLKRKSGDEREAYNQGQKDAIEYAKLKSYVANPPTKGGDKNRSSSYWQKKADNKFKDIKKRLPRNKTSSSGSSTFLSFGTGSNSSSSL